MATRTMLLNVDACSSHNSVASTALFYVAERVEAITRRAWWHSINLVNNTLVCYLNWFGQEICSINYQAKHSPAVIRCVLGWDVLPNWTRAQFYSSLIGTRANEAPFHLAEIAIALSSTALSLSLRYGVTQNANIVNSDWCAASAVEQMYSRPDKSTVGADIDRVPLKLFVCVCHRPYTQAANTVCKFTYMRSALSRHMYAWANNRLIDGWLDRWGRNHCRPAPIEIWQLD